MAGGYIWGNKVTFHSKEGTDTHTHTHNDVVLLFSEDSVR